MKEINGLPGYFVTRDGKVYSNKKSPRNPKGELREMSQWDGGEGYKKVTLCGGTNKCRVHRLVAETYIPNPHNYKTVNHINEDKTDNRVENLEWMSNADNVIYSKAKLHILENKNGEQFEVFNLRKWCREMMMSSGHMHDTYTGRRKWCKGYRIVSVHELSPEDRHARARAAMISATTG